MVDVPLDLDRSRPVPLPRQIADQLRVLISRGQIVKGTTLPASRVLAVELGISRRCVVDAYEQLTIEGWLTSTRGSGTRVADVEPVRAFAVGVAELKPNAPADVDLVPGTLHISERIQRAWRTSIRSAALTGAETEAQGDVWLRSAIAERLLRTRGMTVDPRQIIITAGTAESVLHICLGLDMAGRDVAVEDPGHPRTRAVLALAGARPVPVRVGEDGIDIDEVARRARELAAVVVTPSHQFPLGARMPVPARQRLAALAGESDFVVIEDDYDSEFRYEANALPALATISTETVYLGTLSKSLDPGLRIGYIVATGIQLEQLMIARSAVGSSVAAPIQSAVASLMRSGELDRNVNVQRRNFANRRRLVIDRLQHLDGVERVTGLDAGLHATVEFGSNISSSTLQQRLRDHGIDTQTMDECRFESDLTQPGLLISYSNADIDALDHSLRTLGRILNDLRNTDS